MLAQLIDHACVCTLVIPIALSSNQAFKHGLIHRIEAVVTQSGQVDGRGARCIMLPNIGR